MVNWAVQSKMSFAEGTHVPNESFCKKVVLKQNKTVQGECGTWPQESLWSTVICVYCKRRKEYRRIRQM